MRRGFRNFVAAVSLVLCSAALSTWLRSVHHYDRIDYTRVDRSQRVHRTWIVTSNAGQCTFGRVIFALDQPAANPNPGWEVQSSARSRSPLAMWPPYRPSAFSTEFSFASRRPTRTTVYGTVGTFTDWGVTFPHWVAVVLFLVVALSASASVWKTFSLRLLFAVMTIIAVILGSAIWLNS
jgi:hypothetical protein